MDDTFKIYVDQLREEEQQEISECCPPDFLFVEGGELEFKRSVVFSGVAYLVADNLLLNLHIEAEVLLPCIVCNEWVPIDLVLDNLYLAQRIDEIKDGVYDFKEALREEILLEVPRFAECNEGDCSQRKEIKNYLREEKEDTYHPFEGL